MSGCVERYTQTGKGGGPQSIVPKSHLSENYIKDLGRRKSWMLRLQKFSFIWGTITTKRQGRRQKTKEPSCVISELAVTAQVDFSELYKLSCALSRLPLSTFAVDKSEYHTVEWPVQKLARDYALIVPPPYHTPIRSDATIDLSDFLSKLPESMKIIYEKADPEKLINLMLPEGVICNEARKVAAAFWLWLCITDDILEGMNDEEFGQGIRDMHASLAGYTNTTEYDKNSEISFVTRLFRSLIYNTAMNTGHPAEYQWQQDFIACVQEIAHAFEIERPLLKAGKRVKLEDWMKVRVVTISARPFMVLARASLDIPGGISHLGNPLLAGYQEYTGKPTEGETNLVRFETTLQCILGLQNDILGWEKDNHDNLNLNCVQILIAQAGASTNSGYEHSSLTVAIETHNQLVASAMSRAYGLFGTGNLASVTSHTSANPSRRLSLVPSLSPSNDTSGTATANVSPGTSVVELCSGAPRIKEPVDYEVGILESDSDAGSLSTSVVSFGSFSDILKSSWSSFHSKSIWSFSRCGFPFDDEHGETERICQYVSVLLNMINGMANWMINSKRYAVKATN